MRKHEQCMFSGVVFPHKQTTYIHIYSINAYFPIDLILFLMLQATYANSVFLHWLDLGDKKLKCALFFSFFSGNEKLHQKLLLLSSFWPPQHLWLTGDEAPVGHQSVTSLAVCVVGEKWFTAGWQEDPGGWRQTLEGQNTGVCVLSVAPTLP